MSEHTLKTDNPALREVVALDQYEAVRVRADEAEARIKELEATLTQPETGQPDIGRAIYEAVQAGRDAERQAIRKRVEGMKRPAEYPDFEGGFQTAIDEILTAIQEGGTDE